jgi:hypothetical protein
MAQSLIRDYSSNVGGTPAPVIDYYVPPTVTDEGAVYEPTQAQYSAAVAQLSGENQSAAGPSVKVRGGISLSPYQTSQQIADYWSSNPQQAAYQAAALAQWEAANTYTGPAFVPYAPGTTPPTGGSNPDPIPNGDQPLSDINTLLDAFHNTFAPPSAAAIGPAAPPGVTVIPDTSSSPDQSGNTQLVIFLAVLGIMVTIGIHWWSEHKKKRAEK